MEGIKWFCGVKREEFDEKYKEELKQVNDWYWRRTGEAYIKECEKYNKRKSDEELEKIFEEYEDELREIYNEYIVRENELNQKYLSRKAKKT